jgi:hypothetical protein
MVHLNSETMSLWQRQPPATNRHSLIRLPSLSAEQCFYGQALCFFPAPMRLGCSLPLSSLTNQNAYAAK